MVFTQRFVSVVVALFLVGTGSIIATGCGGGGTASSDATYVTRDTEARYSTEALFLEVQKTANGQVSKSDLVSTASVREIERDLATIRTRYPALTQVKLAGRTQDLRSLPLTVEPNGALAKAWQQGQTLTGVAQVDALLKRYELDSVRPLNTNGASFTLQFKRLLNIERVRYDLTLAANQDSPNIYPQTPTPPTYDHHLSSASGITLITRTDAEAGRVYTFVQGYGDCPAGCIQAHIRTVTVSNDATLSLLETGAPPNGEYGGF